MQSDTQIPGLLGKPPATLILVALIAVLASFAFFPQTTHAATTVYLTSGTSYTVPSDWNNSNNTIEVIGGGASGDSGSGSNGGSGGGGGAYSKVTNVTLSGTVGYAVGGVAGDTYFCNSTSNCASIAGSAVQVGAKGASGSTGGVSGSGVGTTKYSGGSGGGGGANVGSGGGGGGAAGLHGAGGNGSGGTGGTCSNHSGGSGGTGDSGNTSAGANGTQWDATHGSGGGGSGGSVSNVDDGFGGSAGCTGNDGSAGGRYGAGGGGGGGVHPNQGSPVGAGGAGYQGVIVITYTPAFVHTTVTFSGNVGFRSTLNVGGALTKGSGTFVIDHPLYPAKKLLYHSFVESPDVKNIYDGIARLDKNGEAIIKLPDYFDALNKDVRYQFFALNRAMPNLHIKEEEHDNQFTIGGGVAGGKVSWQITGIRHDPYILAHPVIVEVLKGPKQIVNRGECIFEPLCQ